MSDSISYNSSSISSGINSVYSGKSLTNNTMNISIHRKTVLPKIDINLTKNSAFSKKSIPNENLIMDKNFSFGKNLLMGKSKI
jgi:hypothetical protein